ncbi:MAG TPA: hypothetical protein VJ476_01100 [Rhizomicrobium sp.]|nr:hypothetical protein [Rhizomicrobium sp.]
MGISIAILPHLAMAEDPPLLAAFKQFCVYTAADRSAVAAAVISAGGTSRPPENKTPAIGAYASWKVTLNGRTYEVSTGIASSQADTNYNVQTDSCGVDSPAVEDHANIAAIRAWVGVSPSHSFSDVMLIEVYDFQANGQQHAALPSDEAAFHALESSGRVWAMGLMRSPKGTSLNLLHTVPALP